jgi:hypothetical protein
VHFYSKFLSKTWSNSVSPGKCRPAAPRPRSRAPGRRAARLTAPAPAPRRSSPGPHPEGAPFPRRVHRGVLKSVHPVSPLDRPVLDVAPEPAVPRLPPRRTLLPRSWRRTAAVKWLLASRRRCPSRSGHLRRRPASPRAGNARHRAWNAASPPGNSQRHPKVPSALLKLLHSSPANLSHRPRPPSPAWLAAADAAAGCRCAPPPEPPRPRPTPETECQ